jgi:hypothetical protein
MSFLGIGGNKVKALDTGAALAIAQKKKQTTMDYANQQEAQLKAGYAPFEAKRNAISAQLEPGAEKQLASYGQDLNKVGAAEQEQYGQAANQFRQQSFRDVPEVQRAIRDQLGGNRLMGSGAALSSLAKPTIQAAQQSADMASSLEQQRLGNVTNRAEGFATTGFNTRSKAMADRLGMDEQTLNTLQQMGRTDLIDKFNSLSGAESDYYDTEGDLNLLQQQSDMQAQQAKNARRSAIIGTLGSVAGMAAGGIASGGNPLAVAAGGQVGGQLGQMAGGGTPGQVDPTYIAALMQSRKRPVYTPQNPTEARFAMNRATNG